jgi:taurine-pyruvate aminotransferase
VIVEGRGLRVWDATGREFLDAVSGGVWTVNVGYGRERIADAVRDQLVRMNFFAGAAGNVPGAVYARSAGREDAGDEPGLLLELRLGGQ